MSRSSGIAWKLALRLEQERHQPGESKFPRRRQVASSPRRRRRVAKRVRFGAPSFVAAPFAPGGARPNSSRNSG
jgi:hypothetical protein